MHVPECHLQLLSVKTIIMPSYYIRFLETCTTGETRTKIYVMQSRLKISHETLGD